MYYVTDFGFYSCMEKTISPKMEMVLNQIEMNCEQFNKTEKLLINSAIKKGYVI